MQQSAGNEAHSLRNKFHSTSTKNQRKNSSTLLSPHQRRNPHPSLSCDLQPPLLSFLLYK